MGRRVITGSRGSIPTLTISGGTISPAVTNADLTIDNNGTGIIKFDGDVQLNTQNDLRFGDADSSNYVAIQAPTTVSANYTLTLPAAVASTTGFALVSDSSGVLSWAAAGAALTSETASASTWYPVITTSTSGFLTTTSVSNTKMSFVPSTGTLTVTALTESSSITLKENLMPITDALDIVSLLKGWTYDRKDGSSKSEAGLIAEDVYKVLPNLVELDKDGNPASIKYTKLTAYLLEAVKSLKDEVKQLKG